MRSKLLLPVLGLVICGAVALGVGCNAFFGADLPPSLEFRSGQIDGMPPYPGGTQLSGALNLDVPPAMRRFVGDTEAMWAAYRTGDAVEDITFFYLREMERRGHQLSGDTESGFFGWTDGELRYAVHVISDRVQNHVILASGSE